jgi:hypothetical protein
VIDLETRARMAIRLARGFRHGWALAIPKGAQWNARTFAEYAKSARNAPKLEGAFVRYYGRAMDWEIGEHVAEVELTSAGEPAGFVRAYKDTIEVQVVTPSCVSPREIERYDTAITSLSCGPFAELHALPPLRVLLEVLGDKAPSTTMHLYYRPGRVEAVPPEADRLIAAFGAAGGFKHWERMVRRER